jgi:hypothetical protein
MLTSITIKRVSGTVIFETVSINNTDLVFFTNLDTDPDPAKSIHWPEICDEEIDPSSSPPNSSKCLVPAPVDLNPPNNQFVYKCRKVGHAQEQGTINVFAALAPNNVKLAPATKGQSIKEQQVVKGGKSPYDISGEQFQVTDNNNNVIASGSGIGPELKLNPDQTNSRGITVTGKPMLSGTYKFTFTVDDGMGGNLQQVQYSMVVV